MHLHWHFQAANEVWGGSSGRCGRTLFQFTVRTWVGGTRQLVHIELVVHCIFVPAHIWIILPRKRTVTLEHCWRGNKKYRIHIVGLEHSGSAGLLPMNSIRVQRGQQALEIYSKYNYKHKHKYQVQLQAQVQVSNTSTGKLCTHSCGHDCYWRCLKLEPSAILISHNFMQYWHTAQPRYSLIYKMENRIRI